MLRKKHPLTLIEVLISMVLLSLLLSTLFFWYRHLTENKGKLDQEKRFYLEEHYARQRLDHIIPKAKPPFFTDDGVVFRFDRGIFPDPALSNTVLGKLYYNSINHSLCLGIWPDPKKEPVAYPSQTLVLLDHIDELEFEFFSPPDPFQKTVDPYQVGGKPRPIVGWQQTWSSEYEQMPALMAINVTRGKHEHTFYFDLNQPIIYPMETK